MNQTRSILAGLSTAMFFLAFVVAAPRLFAQSATTADVPRLISYQGLLSSPDGQPAVDGPHLITLRLFSDTGGFTPALWSDTFSVVTHSGVFSVLLGSHDPLPAASVISQPLWLGVGVDGVELPTLSPLTASPYALNVADHSITASKMATDYVGSVSINGTQISGQGSNLNLTATNGLSLNYDPVANAIVFSGSGASAGSGKGGDPLGSTQVAGTQYEVLANGTYGSYKSGNVTLTTAQPIATSSSPTFTNLTLTGNGTVESNLSVDGTLSLGTSHGTRGQAVFNDGQSYSSKSATIEGASSYGDNRTYTLPDAGANADFVMDQGNQSIAGSKEFSDIDIDGGTADLSSLTVSGSSELQGRVTLGTTEGWGNHAGQLVFNDNQGWDGKTATVTGASQYNSDRTYTLPDVGANANFVMSEGAQTVNGDKTFSGILHIDSVVTSHGIIPSADTVVSLGDSTHRFKDLFLSGHSLVMGTGSTQTEFSTDPTGGLVITNTDAATTSSTTLSAGGSMTTGGTITSGGSIVASGPIATGNSIIVDGSATPRSIWGDLTTVFSTSAGDILLDPAGSLGVGILYPNNPDAMLEVNGTFHAVGNTTLSGTLDMTGHQINNVADPGSPQDAATRHYVDNLIANQSADLANEVSRAEGVENTLTTNLATTNSNLSAETTRAEAAESTNATTISTETARAEAAESTLTTNLATSNSNLSGETTRAEGAESTNATGISTETARAEAAESTLTTNLGTTNSNLTGETTRAEAAENTKLPLAGGSMAGAIDMGAHSITDLAEPGNPQDAATRHYVDNATTTAISGTADMIAKFTGTNTVGNSGLTDNGTTLSYAGAANLATGGGNVGVGTSTPISQLANTTANTIFSDAEGVSAQALDWEANSLGYTGSVNNADNTAGADGLGIWTRSADPNTRILEVASGTTGGVWTGNPRLIVFGDGTIQGGGWHTDPNGNMTLNGASFGGNLDMAGHTIANVGHIDDGTGGTIAIDANTDFNNHDLSNLGYVILNSTSTLSAVSGTVNFGSSIDVRNNSIYNVAEPVSGQDAATKHYVDSAVSADPSGWSLTGNLGTTAGTDYIGTSDNAAVYLDVDGAPQLILNTDSSLQRDATGDARGLDAVDLQVGRDSVQEVSSGTNSTVSGGNSNTASGNRSTVGGGENNTAGDATINHFTDPTVGGGWHNSASNSEATVAGGADNVASGLGAFVGGGTGPGVYNNTASGDYSAIVGGYVNTASGDYSSLGSGKYNVASGSYSIVPGGELDTASGNNSTALGSHATASHSGSFVYGDASGNSISDPAANTFNVLATGGYNLYDDASGTAALTLASGNLHATGNISQAGENVAAGGTLDGNSNIYELTSGSSTTTALPTSTTAQIIYVYNSTGSTQTIGGQTVTNGHGASFVYFPTSGWQMTATF